MLRSALSRRIQSSAMTLVIGDIAIQAMDAIVNAAAGPAGGPVPLL
jgi:hypothetical protein